MKNSSLALLVMTIVTSTQAFALSYDCEVNQDSDAYSRVTLTDDGDLQVQFHEYFAEVPAKSVTTQISTDYENIVDTHLTIANNVSAKYSVEGETGEALATALFVYNPRQKAGRLTFIQNNRTFARNTLFTSCK